MNEKPKTIAELANEISDATITYEHASAEKQAASMRETAARNSLNNAQKAFDKAVEELKAKAPRDSDWMEAKRRKVPVEDHPGKHF